MKTIKKQMQNQRGLTLIELLVVIVILGIIAAIAVPMVMSQKDAAELNTNQQNLSIVQDAVNRYYTVTDEWPDSVEDLESDYLNEVPDCADGADATYTITDGVVGTSCPTESTS